MMYLKAALQDQFRGYVVDRSVESERMRSHSSSTFPWLEHLALPSGSTALAQDERDRRYHRDNLL